MTTDNGGECGNVGSSGVSGYGQYGCQKTQSGCSEMTEKCRKVALFLLSFTFQNVLPVDKCKTVTYDISVR